MQTKKQYPNTLRNDSFALGAIYVQRLITTVIIAGLSTVTSADEAYPERAKPGADPRRDTVERRDYTVHTDEEDVRCGTECLIRILVDSGEVVNVSTLASTHVDHVADGVVVRVDGLAPRLRHLETVDVTIERVQLHPRHSVVAYDGNE